MPHEYPKPTPEEIETIMRLNVVIGRMHESNLREIVSSHPDIVKLNDLLAYDCDNNGDIHLHVLPNSYSTINEKVTLMREGLKLAAQELLEHPEIQTLYATSWIVAENSKLLEMLGFTIEGEISETERSEIFSEEPRDVWKASISREDFIARYL